MRLGLMASGRGSNVAAILAAIDAGRLTADAVVLVCDRAGAPVIDLAREHDVPVELVTRDDHPDRGQRQRVFRDVLLEHRAEVVALAGFAAVLDPIVVDAFEGRMLNIHPSLLPAFAGSVAPEPQAAALRAGVKISGCTVHIVTNALDAGPIVAQAAVPVLADDDVASLSARILHEEHRLYVETLQWFAEGRVIVQDGIAAVLARPT